MPAIDDQEPKDHCAKDPYASRQGFDDRAVDVLADVISATRIGHTILCRTEVLAPWGMRFDPCHQVSFHIVARGACWLRPRVDAEPIQLVQGDILLLPHGGGHTLSDHPATPVLPYREVVAKVQEERNVDPPAREGRSTVLICGTYVFEEQERHPLLRLLPQSVHIPTDEARDTSSLQKVLRVLMREFCDREPGSAAVISSLTDTLFVLVVRAWLARQAECSCGWLGALRDPQIGTALSFLHGNPARPWTVEAIAREVGMSRAAFAKRFAQRVGETPLAYLTRWRMDLAARLLRESDRHIYAIAASVGYESETAFSKAFRRAYDLAPGGYRAHHDRALVR